jgi:signal transduction histidine kinase
MNTKLLGALGVLLALVCWAALIVLRFLVFRQPFSARLIGVELGLVVLGSIIFWRWIITVLERQAKEVRQRTDHLEALHSASIALTTEHDLTAVLQKVVDLSRALLNAKYGALGILDEDGSTIAQLITSGLSSTSRARMDRFPRTHGLLGVPIVEHRSIRVDSIAADPRSRGFPSNHPTMTSFLGVPLISKGRVFGNLYLADKVPDLTSGKRGQTLAFTQEDQEILEMFANQAATAIENAQLYRQNQQIAILQERERFGMDLHDGVIQSIYAIGLMLDNSRHQLESAPAAAQDGIAAAITGLNQVIKDIRNYIHDLRSSQLSGHNLQQGLEELARDLQTYSVLTIDVAVDPAALKRLSAKQTGDLLQIAREALSNIRKHAHATRVSIRVQPDNSGIALIVEDNGMGFDIAAGQDPSGHGLRNMAERAHHLDGVLDVSSVPSGGTRIAVTLPA